jgi:hypothetical protein
MFELFSIFINFKFFIMKKQILNIGKALNRAEQKQVFGGKMAAEYDGGGWVHWVSCSNGETYQALDCDGWAVGLCVSLGSTMTSCSSWPG